MRKHTDIWDLLDSGLRPPLSLDAGDLPEPYRDILVHDESMCSALEAAYSDGIRLRILHRQLSEGMLVRRVVLVRKTDERPLVMGVIRIHLEHFSPAVRKRVLDGKTPLGTLLLEFGVRYSNRPTTFFEVASKGMIGEALSLTKLETLYGRYNRLLVPSGHTLADVIEILAPFAPGVAAAD